MGKKKTTEQFISEARYVHGDRYDYRYTRYQDSTLPVTVLCRTHGKFLVLPSSHLHSKKGCDACKYGQPYSVRGYKDTPIALIIDDENLVMRFVTM